MPAKTKYYRDFSGGINYYHGPRQVEDNQSPNAINCDFKGKSGVGNRQGYSQVGAVADSRTKIFGMNEYHTTTLDQLIKFASNGTNIAGYFSTGGAWTALTGNTFTNNLNVDTVQATIMTSVPTPGTPVSTNGLLFTFNGVDAMQKIDGSSVAAHTGGTIGLYGEYYDKRLWCVDDQYKDVINFSVQTTDATKALDFTANGTSSNPGTVTIRPGSGATIRGLKSFKGSLYVFLYPYGIYRITTATEANTFTVELITNAVGCVSHRSIQQVGEDLFFCADDGVYSLGDVANYSEVRTTNKSAKIQRVFDSLSGANKAKLCAVYHNFKYHLFYSLYGTANDSCIVYDIRYKAWQDWRNIPANDATIYTDGSDETNMYFGCPTTGKVYQMYDGSTDAGTAIASSWDSKSYDEEIPDVMKLYFDSTFVFGTLNGTVNVSAIFNDSEFTASRSLTQTRPQGGMGRHTLGRKPFGAADNTVTVSQVIGTPQRLQTKGQKFAIQFRVTSSGEWRLDTITNYRDVFDHYKFDSAYKLN